MFCVRRWCFDSEICIYHSFHREGQAAIRDTLTTTNSFPPTPIALTLFHNFASFGPSILKRAKQIPNCACPACARIPIISFSFDCAPIQKGIPTQPTSTARLYLCPPVLCCAFLPRSFWTSSSQRTALQTPRLPAPGPELHRQLPATFHDISPPWTTTIREEDPLP